MAEVAAKLIELRGGQRDVWIEHRKLRKARGIRYKIASAWLEWFRTEGLRYCSFKVFAVDQEGFRKFPYPGEYGWDFHIWKNTLTTFVAGIQWSLPKVKGILLDVICDSTDNVAFQKAVALLPSSIKADMLCRRRRQRERYAVARNLGKRRTLRLAPLVRVRGTPRLVSSRPDGSSVDCDERELVQLTDVILGVLWDAVRARKVDEAGRSGRHRLAREFLELLDPSVALAWGARLPLRRAISISMYPDEHGRAYPATVLTTRPGQQQICFPPELWTTKAQKIAGHGIGDFSAP